MALKQHYKTLRLILGDQLNANHSWYALKDSSTLYVIAELTQETNYVAHHIQKLCAFFSAMQNFADALKQSGHEVLYLSLDETAKYQDLPSLIDSLTTEYQVKRFGFQRPDEYRLQQQLSQLTLSTPLAIEVADTEHFLLPYDEITKQFKSGQHHKMEFFYRKMRKRFDILMDGDKPLGEQWNFDSDNRKALKAADLDSVPAPMLFSNDVSDIIKRLRRHKIKTIGTEQQSLIWPTSRSQALEMLILPA